MDYWSDGRLASIHKMLNPRSIAVVGATERMQYGGRFLRAAMQSAARGVRVYPVNPRYGELLGMKCYPSVSDLPEAPDVVGVIVPYHRVIPVLRESGARGAGSAIVISAGFAERGSAERRDLQAELGAAARETGVRISGPNCLGLANVKDDIWACSSSRLEGVQLKSGGIGLVCQSGASAFGPFLTRAAERGIGYSYIVSTGNEADLDAPDFARYLLDDDDTKAIAMFIEGFRDARKFLEVAKLAAERGKPIAAVKIGRSALGTRAAQSHTAALTGADEIYDAAFEQHGVTRVHDWDRLLETAQMLADFDPPSERGVALISHSGGVCSLTADNLGDAGIALPPLSDAAREGIDAILEGFGWAANPADITGHAARDTLVPIMERMIAEPNVGALVLASSGSDEQARRVIGVRDSAKKPVIFLHTGAEMGASTGLDALKDAGVPVFDSPENLASALRDFHAYHDWRARREAAGGFAQPAPMTDAQRAAADSLRAADGAALSEYDAKRIIAAWGIQSPNGGLARSADEAARIAQRVGFPVAVKANSPDLLHKTEARAVALGVQDESAVRAAYRQVTDAAAEYDPSARVDGALVEEMVEDGVETIIGITYDPQLGPVILYGMGGLLAEIMRDVALRICPVTEAEAREMIAAVRGSRLLAGFRGAPPADVDALATTIAAASQMALRLEGAIAEMDVNPLAVLPNGRGVRALDCLIIRERSEK